MRFILEGSRLIESIPFADAMKEQAKEYFQEMIFEFLHAAADVLVDLISSITLLGGGLLIIIWAVTGEKKAGRWFGILFIINIAVKLILGAI